MPLEVWWANGIHLTFSTPSRHHLGCKIMGFPVVLCRALVNLGIQHPHCGSFWALSHRKPWCPLVRPEFSHHTEQAESHWCWASVPPLSYRNWHIPKPRATLTLCIGDKAEKQPCSIDTLRRSFGTLRTDEATRCPFQECSVCPVPGLTLGIQKSHRLAISVTHSARLHTCTPTWDGTKTHSSPSTPGEPRSLPLTHP